MLKTLLLSASLAGLSFLYTDLASESAWKSKALPAIMVISLIVLALAIVLRLHRAGISQTGSTSSDFSDFD